MLVKPYVYGLPSGLNDISGINVADLFRISGGNTGNFYFTHSVHRLLRNTTFSYGHERDAKKIRQNHDCVVIPAANWINPAYDWGELADMIEEADLPCILIGIGAQAKDASSAIQLKQGTIRFLQAASARCASISVRGEYTKDVLKSLGIENVTVTGCPSLLLFSGKPLRQTGAVSYGNIALNSTRHAYNEEIFTNNLSQRLHLALYRVAVEMNAEVVLQSELPDWYFTLKRFADPGICEKSLAFLERVYATPREKLMDFLKYRQYVFFNTNNWGAFLEKKRFVFGTRIHGAIAGLIAGTPACVITHDARTAELCETMSIPSFSVEEVGDCTADRILEIANSVSFASFVDSFSKYRKRFRRFFKDNDLKII
jgi:hypothetical protein